MLFLANPNLPCDMVALSNLPHCPMETGRVSTSLQTWSNFNSCRQRGSRWGCGRFESSQSDAVVCSVQERSLVALEGEAEALFTVNKCAPNTPFPPTLISIPGYGIAQGTLLMC